MGIPVSRQFSVLGFRGKGFKALFQMVGCFVAPVLLRGPPVVKLPGL